MVLCCTAKLTLGMFVIVLPMKLHSNPFQLPPSVTHPPSSSSCTLPFQRNCSCISEYVFHGPWWIHPVDSAKPFMHRKHSIPFQVERRWRAEGERRGRAKDSPHNRLLGPRLFTKRERKTQTVRQEGMGGINRRRRGGGQEGRKEKKQQGHKRVRN